MSSKELYDKLQTKKMEVKNAEKMKKYGKIQTEMKVFSEEAHDDFKTMFKGINEKNISEDMKIFWQAQTDALEKPDSRGNRWHPK
jgi:hypothetical protein